MIKEQSTLATAVYAAISDIDPNQPHAREVLSSILIEVYTSEVGDVSAEEFMYFCAGRKCEMQLRKITEASLP